MTTDDQTTPHPPTRDDQPGRIKAIVSRAEMSPEDLAALSFDEAVERLSQADLAATLSDDQEIALVGFLMSNCRRF